MQLRFSETLVEVTEPKHEMKKQVFRRKRLVKVEMQFFVYFFSASAKKVKEEIIVVFIFWHRPKKRNKKTLALGKITYPSLVRI
jgi:hypothetical protein